MLTSPEITELTSESGPPTILGEWLRFYFDGGAHDVGLQASVVFPRVNIAFDQGAPEQPLEKGTGVEIRVLLLPRAETSVPAATSQYAGNLVRSHQMAHFWISAKLPGKGQGLKLCQRVADLLKALLTNPDTRVALAEKGIVNLAPRHSATVNDPDYDAKKLLPCDLTVEYPVLYGVQPIALDAQEVPVTFVREAVLVMGEYLTGEYVFSTRSRATYARATGWASQGADTVLQLEVGGVLTGVQLTLPMGAPEAEVSAEAVLTNVWIERQTTVRWRVISGPANLEDAAWRVGVMLRVKP